MKNTPIESLSPTLNNPALQNYLVKMADLKSQLANLSATYTPEHYKVRQVQAQIADLQQAINAERANILRRSKDDYEAAQAREDMLAAAYAEQLKTVSDMAGKSIQYDNLQHEVDTNRELYDALFLTNQTGWSGRGHAFQQHCGGRSGETACSSLPAELPDEHGTWPSDRPFCRRRICVGA